jgi:hypothetical protein
MAGVDLPYENLVPDLAASSQLFQTTSQLDTYQHIKEEGVPDHRPFPSSEGESPRRFTFIRLKKRTHHHQK